MQEDSKETRGGFHEMGRKPRTARVLRFAAFMVAGVAIAALVVMLLWNLLMPSLSRNMMNAGTAHAVVTSAYS